MRFFRLLALAGIASVAPVVSIAGAAVECHGLVGRTFGAAEVTNSDDVAAPLSLRDPNGAELAVSTPFCRVRGVIRPTADSNINFEVWLPSAQAWNGKYQGVGNGGFLGAIMYSAMQRALRSGYAVSSTDTGHTSTSIESQWALGHPEKIADWGWRAIHETALASKAIVATYYSTAPKYSYFVGCSKGGGSAMMEAQRFPTDYNGIVAAAPGMNQSGQVASYLWALQAVAQPRAWISPAKITVLNRAVLEACKADNGLLDDPATCHFDPGRLQCKTGDGSDCLTAEQVAAARKIYSGPLDAHHESLYPGLARGGEYAWSRMIMGPEDQAATGSILFPSMMGYLGNLLFGNSDWDFHTLSASEVMSLARQRLTRDFDATNPDLGAFKAAGGKLIMLQGWNDPIVRPSAAIQYNDSVAAKMGGRTAVQSFYRLFMAPGMDHCGGGPGPNAVGGAMNLPAPTRDAQHDIVAALEQWVEQGRAPDRLTATLYQDNDPSKAVIAQRPWCAYPQVAGYSGHGDRDEAASYVCRRPLNQ